MLEVATDLLTGFLDRLAERQPVGQAGQAVAKHLGAKRALGLDLDGAVDDAQQAAGGRAVDLGQRRKLDPEIARRNALAVLEVELTANIGAVEEPLQEVGDRPGLQAVGVVPVGRGAGGALDGLEKAAVVGGDVEIAALAAQMIAAAIGKASSKPISPAVARCGFGPELSARRCPLARGSR